jgi:hypothetical protein
MELRRSVSRVF